MQIKPVSIEHYNWCVIDNDCEFVWALARDDWCKTNLGPVRKLWDFGPDGGWLFVNHNDVVQFVLVWG